jgi:predicted acylesterase/phospholipase RssA
MTLLDRLTAEGPKRILALDGGGIRGALTLGYLERIEGILRCRHQKEDLRLCEYFDLIGGTSTGAIIAAALAIGLSASEIKQMYLELGGRVFGRKKLKIWDARFDEKPLIEELARVFGERKLGEDSVLTGLCIVTKRADTASTWPLINHPRGKYYGKNGPIPLREAVRASTAAPTYFVPQRLMVGGEEWGAFVDGGVSMANNPALQLFLVATLKGFPFRWPVGENHLLLVSVGTGLWTRGKKVEDISDDKLWDWAAQVPELLMDDANWQNQLLLQYLSRTATPWEIDGEVPALQRPHRGTGPVGARPRRPRGQGGEAPRDERRGQPRGPRPHRRRGRPAAGARRALPGCFQPGDKRALRGARWVVSPSPFWALFLRTDNASFVLNRPAGGTIVPTEQSKPFPSLTRVTSLARRWRVRQRRGGTHGLDRS